MNFRQKAGYIVLFSLAFQNLGLPAEAETLEKSFSFSFQDLRIVEKDGFQQVELGGETGSGWPAGAPWLPVKEINLLLPEGATVTGVKILAAESALPGPYKIAPAQDPVPLSQPAPLVRTPPDPAIYASAALFPSASGESGAVHEMRGYRFLSVRLFPLRYQPADQILWLATQLTVRVNYTIAAAKLTSRAPDSAAASDLFATIVSKTVANPEALAATRNTVDGTPLPQSGTPTLDYLIVTSAALSNSFQQLANYRATYNGFSTRVLSVEVISATYTGVDTQAKIRNCINSLYRSNSLTYVVLGGDNTVVPDRDCYVSCGSYTESAMPTDLYYAGLDSSWNEDGDGNYGEADIAGGGDEGDLAYDVIVGRIPVRSAADASGYIGKLMRYESTSRPPPSFHKKFMVSGYLLWDSYSGADRPADLCNDGHAEFQAHTPVSDADIWQRRAYRDFVKPFWTAGTFSIFTDTLTTWDGATAGDYVQSAANLNTRLNEGWQLVDMYTHGNTTIWGLESGNYGTANATALTGLTAVIYTEACLTGGFDSGEPSLSEAFVRNTNGGAVIYLGCSRYGWGSPGSTYGGPSADFAEQFLRQLFQLRVNNVGQAFIAHKIAMASSSGYNGSDRWIQFGLNLQGDPGLTLALTAPGITLTDPVAGTQYKAGDSLTLAATTSDGINVITNVLFFVADSPVGSSASAPHTATWTVAGSGLVSLHAVAQDDGGYQTTSTAVQVEIVANFSPAVAITNPVAGTLLPDLTDVTIAASASDPDGVVTQVAFYGDSALIGTDRSAPYQAVWSAPAGGSHAVHAIAWDSEGASATSAPVAFLVARDHFTEEFTSSSPEDLAGWALTFTPDGLGSYTACREAIATLPNPTNGAAGVTLGDDDSSTVMLFGSTVLFFGTNYSTFYLNSNGNISFNEEDTGYTATPATHFAQRRISLMFRDLNPSAGGSVSYQVLSNRVVVTYLNVPEFGKSTPNTAQLEMFNDGRLRISWLTLDLTTGIMGLSPGGGIPAGFVNSDLSALSICAVEDPDTDADGMPDWWEEANFGGATNATPGADTDGDGVSNFDEWIGGSCATNSASCFEATQQTFQPGAGTVISWPSASNRLYQLDGASSLLTPFSPVASGLPATPPLNTYTDTTHSSDACLFYRVRAQLAE